MVMHNPVFVKKNMPAQMKRKFCQQCLKDFRAGQEIVMMYYDYGCAWGFCDEECLRLHLEGLGIKIRKGALEMCKGHYTDVFV